MAHNCTRFSYFARRAAVLVLLLCGLCAPAIAQQSGSKGIAAAAAARRDSLATARQQTLDSARASRQQILDSSKASRQQKIDSVKEVRAHLTDSLTSLRKYRESRAYRDSVADARQARTDDMHDRQTARMDSLKDARKAFSDSLLAVRSVFTDSVRAVQKARTDSLTAIRRYRESKRYMDSVAIVRRQSLDSLRAVRQAFSDSATASRKTKLDSTITARKAMMDELTATRTKTTDSLKAYRKVRADSLLAVKEKRDKLNKVNAEKKVKKMELAIDLKIKSKRSAWNNEKMLKKKWSLPRQVLQNTYTRYNYYYNANRKMEEAKANMARIGRDNFDTTLALYTFNPDRDSTVLASDMDSVIQKASLGIQIHDPRAKWADDLYLLLGMAYYYRGDYDNAEASFHYIVGMRDRYRKKPSGNDRAARPKADAPAANKVATPPEDGLAAIIKHKPAANDALLWLCRTYTQSGNTEGSEMILDLLGSEPDLPADMAPRISLERGFLALMQKDYQAAATALSTAAASNILPDEVRRRAAFIAAQLLQQQQNYTAAADQYRAVLRLNPKLDMDFYARKNLAASLLQSGAAPDETIASLKSILKDNKYAPYHEQVYYLLGRLAANSSNPAEAITYLQKSISSPRTTKKQKAVSFAALGNAYYNTGDYLAAQHAYDSVKAFSNMAPGDAEVALALRRGKVLRKIAEPAYTIRTQDSLLTLGALPEKDRIAAVRRYLASLQQRRDDSIARAESAITNPNMVASSDAGSDLGNNPAYAWYFSNATLMQSGLTDFKRKWGNRPLADNWRRASALGFATGGGTNTAPAGTSGGPDVIGSNAAGNSAVAIDANGFPTEAALLGAIPTTDVRRQQATTTIQRSYVDLGTAYTNDLEDYTRAGISLDTLDARYTSHTLRAEELYLRYQISLRNNQLPQAQGYATEILRDYNNTQYAGLVRPAGTSGVNSADATGSGLAGYYDETYTLLQSHNYDDVLQRVGQAGTQYNDVRYNNKFLVVKALALAGGGQYGAADTLLSGFIATSPQDSLRGWADEVLRYVKKNTPPPVAAPQAGVSSSLQATAPAATNTPPAANNGRPLVPQAPEDDENQAADDAAADSTGTMPPIAPGTALPPVPDVYSYNPAAPHLFVFAFGKVESKAMGVKAALGDFNTLRFSGQALNTGLDIVLSTQGFITVQPFANAAQAKTYLNTFKATPQITREFTASGYQVFIISAANYQKLKTDKKLADYLSFYNNRYK